MATDANAPEMNVDLALELFSIAGSLNSTVDLDFLLQKIGTAAEQLTESEASSIMLVTDDKKSLFFRIASGEKAKALKTMSLPIGQGIAGWVAQNRKPQMVNDTRKDPVTDDFYEYARLEGRHYRICATFDTDDTQRQDGFAHPAGHTCFNR